MEEFNDTPLLRKHFHVRRHFARLPLCCYRTATELMNYWQEGSPSIAVSPASTSDIMGQHIKIGGITFGVLFLIKISKHDILQCFKFITVTYKFQ
jgi:hypothetical protein